jgi:hypothetical protein
MSGSYPSHNIGPLGTVRCIACGQQIEVRYTYSNSTRSIQVRDHQFGYGERCLGAGRELACDGKWLKGAGYSPADVAWTSTIDPNQFRLPEQGAPMNEEQQKQAEVFRGAKAPNLDISLYHLEEGLANLIAYRQERVLEIDGPLEAGELDAIEAEIKRYEIATPAKVAGVAAILRSWRIQRENAKAEIRRLQSIVATLEAQDDRLKTYIADVLAMQPEPKKGCRQLTGNDGSKLMLKGNGGLQPLEITDPALVPNEYKRVTLTINAAEWDDLCTIMEAAQIIAPPTLIPKSIEVDNTLVRNALASDCPECAGLTKECAACAGTGKRGVPGARLLDRGSHVEVR